VYFVIFSRISPGVLQTSWFIASVISEILFLFLIRTNGLFFKTKRPSSVLLLLSAIVTICTLIIPFTHFGVVVLEFTRLKGIHLIIIFGVIGMYVLTTECIKLLYYQRRMYVNDNNHVITK
jgi:Mg2+-importing ATPase